MMLKLQLLRAPKNRSVSRWQLAEYVEFRGDTSTEPIQKQCSNIKLRSITSEVQTKSFSEPLWQQESRKLQFTYTWQTAPQVKAVAVICPFCGSGMLNTNMAVREAFIDLNRSEQHLILFKTLYFQFVSLGKWDKKNKMKNDFKILKSSSIVKIYA